MNKYKLGVFPIRLLLIGLGSFALAAILAWLASYDKTFGLFNFQLLGSFGASIAIVVALPESDAARIKSIIFGSLLSAIVGVVVLQYIDNILWLKVAIAISVAIVLMIATDTLHPPGGAIALMVVVSAEKLEQFSYVHLLSPVLFGTLLISVFTVFYRNLIVLGVNDSDR